MVASFLLFISCQCLSESHCLGVNCGYSRHISPTSSLPPPPSPISVSLACIYLFLPTSCVLKVWTMCVLGHLGPRRAGKKWSMQSTIVCSFTTIEHIYISFHRHKQTHTRTHSNTLTTDKTHKHNIYSTEKSCCCVLCVETQKIHCGCKCKHRIYATCSRLLELCRANYYRDPQPPCSCSGVCGSSKHQQS